MSRAGDIRVVHHAAQSRFEAVVQNQSCVAEYVMSDGRMIFTHTFVPPELRGQGIAERIVRFALDDARSKGLKVTPACSYVARFIDRHGEYRDLVA
jgi:predicted GNAT family acetyltransferase